MCAKKSCKFIIILKKNARHEMRAKKKSNESRMLQKISFPSMCKSLWISADMKSHEKKTKLKTRILFSPDRFGGKLVSQHGLWKMF